MHSDHALFQQICIPTTPEAIGEVLPARFGQGRYWLGFDGRLDNREDLARTLAIGRIADMPDSILVARAWEHWGEDTPAHLLGDFAAAVWDEKTRTLTLACDQTTGGRPIFYHATEKRLIFSTNLAKLLVMPDVPRALDPAQLARAAQWSWPGNGRSPFQHIAQVPPAGRVRWSENGLRIDRYWQPDWSRRIRYRRDSDYVEAARELLDRAVAAQSRVIGPLMAELSGGLDSTAIVATAARAQPHRPMISVTAVSEDQAILPAQPPHVFYDEWARVQAVATLYPNLTTLRVPAAPMTAEMADPRRQFVLTGTPGANPFDSSWFDPARQRLRDLGASAVLVGSAGNLTLSAQRLSYLADLAARGRWFGLLRHAWSLGNGPGDATTLAVLRRAAARVRSGRGAATQALGPAVAERYRRPEPDRTAQADGRFAADWQGFFERTVESRRIANHAARALHGLETRDPLGYLPLLEFCFAIPREQYLRDGVPRALARRVLADRLPLQVVQEQRIGRQCPELAARIGGQREWLRATLVDVARSPLAAEILDTAWIGTTIAAIPADVRLLGAEAITPLRRVAAGLQVGQFVTWVEDGCAGLEA
ncbi:asparagine synthetase B family protein [Sphingomonas sp. MMS24-J45]|uniref:asparagine synthetase B family protein n=1 Tax=Sphingomonas sp. MMS24-J45 TaxID=3238806 RepID=UPI00384D8CAD